MEEASLKALETLPPLPYLAHEILLAVNEADPSLSTVARALAREPAVSARIVSMANSAFFLQQRPIYSLEEAIVRLGLNRVRVLAASMLLAEQFDASRCPPFRAARYWQNAVSCALAATRVARYVPLAEDGDAAYLAGLLYNIGLLLLVHVFPGEMASLLKACGRDPRLSLAHECHERLGCDYHEAGKMLLREWNLPAPLVEVAGHCHEADYAGPHARLVHTIRICSSWAEKSFLTKPDTSALPDLPTARLDPIARECRREQEQLEAFARLLAAV